MCQGVLQVLPIHSLISTHRQQAGRPHAVHILQAGDPRPERHKVTSHTHRECVRELEKFNPITYHPAKAPSTGAHCLLTQNPPLGCVYTMPMFLHITVCLCPCICADVPHTPSVTSNRPVHRRRVNPLFIWAPTALWVSLGAVIVPLSALILS